MRKSIVSRVGRGGTCTSQVIPANKYSGQLGSTSAQTVFEFRAAVKEMQSVMDFS